jgi:hypothetical protein
MLTTVCAKVPMDARGVLGVDGLDTDVFQVVLPP